VLFADAIEHVRDVQLMLSEIRRVLRPGGMLALTTPAHMPIGRREHPLSPHLHLFTRASLRRLLDELGFEVESLKRRRGALVVRAGR
jgi:2-polyprenyl-3-methyl-5-hydroxy-6-metoxy-1,4-benzoquinol methylase